MHLRPTGDPANPFVFANSVQDVVDGEQLRSLRSVTVKAQRPHSIAGVIESPEEQASETPRSLRSFSMAADRADDSVSQLTATGENVRSLRSYNIRPGGAVLSLPPDNNETTRSLRSFTVRGRNSEKAMSDTSSENGEHDRSEGTLTQRPGSTNTLVQEADFETDENARSLRSVSVYHNN
jgi:hypothetical protein